MRAFTEAELLKKFEEAMRHLADGSGKHYADIILGSVEDDLVEVARQPLQGVFNPRPLKLVSSRPSNPAPEDELTLHDGDEPSATDPDIA